MTVERASPAGKRSRVAPALVVSAVLSVLLGFRLGMERQDSVGFGIQFPARGLDLSYTYATNRAAAEGRVFGRDFISTYGPHGRLLAAMDVGTSLWPWIGAQLLLSAGLGLTLAGLLLRGRAATPAGLATSGLALLFVHALADEYRWLSLIAILVLLGLRVPARGERAALVGAGLLAGFGLLVKLSLGFGALLTVGAGAVLGKPVRAAARGLAIAAVAAGAGLLAGLWLHQGSAEGLGDYLATSFAVTGGYSSAMSVVPQSGYEGSDPYLAFAAVLAAAAVLGDARLRTAVLALGPPLFVAFKHSLVRQDGHVLTFIPFALVVLTLLVADLPRELLPRCGPPLALAAAFLVLAWTSAPASGPRSLGYLADTLGQPLSLPGLRGLLLLGDLPGYRASRVQASEAALVPLRLPDAARDLVGDEGLDVYPWEASYLLANGFRWANRPSPASFATFTPALDGRNASFFQAQTRPRLVLWHPTEGVRSIDRRHLFWDEPKTLLTLLDRYEVAWRGSVALLRPRPMPRLAPPERIMTVRVEWDTWFTLPRTDDGLLAEVLIDAPLRSRVRRLVLREDPAVLHVRFDTGKRSKYRYVPDQAASGLLLNPLPRTGAEAVDLFAGACPPARVEAVLFGGGFRPGARGPRVTLYRLRGASGGPAFGCGDQSRFMGRS
jgi:hypothetical protein